jgi:rubrerythrin
MRNYSGRVASTPSCIKVIKRYHYSMVLNCGNLFYGVCAPDPCPVCGYPQGYYQRNCENY